MDRPNPLERLFASLFALWMALVRGVLGAPFVALRRALTGVVVRQAPVEALVPLRHAVLRPGRPVEEARWTGDGEPATRHWVVEWGGEIVGVATVLARPFPDGDGPRWQLRGMATAPEVRGRGIGAALLTAVARDVGEPMWCNARIAAQGFYARLGWIAHGDTFELPGVGPHVRMTWTP